MEPIRALGRILVVVAHPDDETWAFGALLASTGGVGQRPCVYCLTEGGAGLSPADPPKRRVDELVRACMALGCRPLGVGEYPDGGLALVDPRVLAEDVARIIARIRPDTVFTFDTDGGYGHRDHIATTHAVLDAVVSADPLWRPRLFVRMFPPDSLRPVRDRLARLKAAPPIDTGVPLGTPLRHATLSIPIAPVERALHEALRCHTSQLPEGMPDNFLGRNRLARLRRAEGDHEHYREWPIVAEPLQ